MGLVTPLPRGPWWALALGLLLMVAGMLSMAVLSSPWPFLVSVAGLVVFVQMRGVRCPQCRRRLIERRVPVQGGPTYSIFWECPRCVALWDGEMAVDPTSD